MNLVVVVVVGLGTLFRFLADGHGALDAFDGRRQLLTSDDATFGKFVRLEFLACRPQDGERMVAEHQHFSCGFRMKNDKHVRNSHNGYLRTLPEAGPPAKTENDSVCSQPPSCPILFS